MGQFDDFDDDTFYEEAQNNLDLLNDHDVERWMKIDARKNQPTVQQTNALPSRETSKMTTGGPIGGHGASTAPAEQDRTDYSFGSGHGAPQVDFQSQADPSSGRKAIRSALAGATSDISTGIARMTGDKEAEAEAKSDGLARLAGSMISPLNKIGGGTVKGQMLNAAGQGALSSIMRGEDLPQIALETAIGPVGTAIAHGVGGFIGKFAGGAGQEAADLAQRKAVTEIASMSGRGPEWVEETLSDPVRVKALLDSWRQARGSAVGAVIGGSAPIAQKLQPMRDVASNELSNIENSLPNRDLQGAISSTDKRISDEVIAGQNTHAAELRDLLNRLQMSKAEQVKLGALSPEITTPDLARMRKDYATAGDREKGWLIPGSTPEGAAKAADQADIMIRTNPAATPEQISQYDDALSGFQGVNDAAGAASNASVQATKKEIGGAAISSSKGFVGSLAPLSSRLHIGLQAHHDAVMTKALQSPNETVRKIAQWVSEAGDPATRAIRTYIATQKNPEYMKVMQEEANK